VYLASDVANLRVPLKATAQRFVGPVAVIRESASGATSLSKRLLVFCWGERCAGRAFGRYD
jgi:hypothetical protein